MPIALPKRILFSSLFFTLYTFFPVFSPPHEISSPATESHPDLPDSLFRLFSSAGPFFTFTFLLYIAPNTLHQNSSPHAQLLRTAYVSLAHYASFRSSLLSIVSKKQPRAIINRPGSKMHNILFPEEKIFIRPVSHIRQEGVFFPAAKGNYGHRLMFLSSDQALRHNLRNSFRPPHYIRSVHRI